MDNLMQNTARKIPTPICCGKTYFASDYTCFSDASPFKPPQKDSPGTIIFPQYQPLCGPLWAVPKWPMENGLFLIIFHISSHHVFKTWEKVHFPTQQLLVVNFGETWDGLDSLGACRHLVSPNHPSFQQNYHSKNEVTIEALPITMNLSKQTACTG